MHGRPKPSHAPTCESFGKPCISLHTPRAAQRGCSRASLQVPPWRRHVQQRKDWALWIEYRGGDIDNLRLHRSRE